METANINLTLKNIKINSIEDVTQLYDDVWKLRDTRVDGLPLMGSPFPTILITLAYLYIVKIWGPSFMKNRQPYNLRTILILYNFAVVIVNIYIHSQAWKLGLVWQYSYMCEPCDYSVTPVTLKLIDCVYIYYISKFVDFLDTIFFVLRKKFTHISVLHVFHHSVMPLNTWVVLRFAPGGHGVFPGFVNSFVHAVMYTYYGIAALGPKYKKLLWWKRYVTVIQLIQFVIGLIHMVQPVFIECDYPIVILYWLLPQGTTFLILFINFYVKNYLNKSPKKHDKINGHTD